MLNQQQAITLFQSLIEDARRLKTESINTNMAMWSSGFERWKTVCEDSIAQIFGEGSRNLLSFQNIKYVPLVNNVSDSLAFIVGLDIAIQRLEGMLITIQLWWSNNIQLSPNIFISCGGSAKKDLIPKLKELISSLGMKPIIAEEEPNYNLSPQDKVRTFINLSNAGIAIITAEDLQKNGEFHPRANVVHEIGLMQENSNIGGRIIYMKENKLNLPSNLQITYISFNRKSFESSYVELIKNIKAFVS